MPVEVPLRGWRSLRLLRYGVLAAIGGVCFCQLPGLRRSPHPLRAVAEVETQEVDAQLRNLRDLASQGLANEAEDALYEMIDAGVKPESLHFSAIIASCAPNADVDRAERWLFRMKALEVEPTMEVFQELMHVAAEAGNPTAAEQWMNEAWQEGHEPSLQSFKYLLRSLRKSGDSVRVETWFERLMQMQLQPDMDCVNEIIGAYVDQENLEKAIEWKAIAKRLGLIPNVDTYKLLIATYAKMGLLQEAEDLFDEMQKDRQEVPEAEFYALLTGDGRSFRPRETVEEWSQRLLDAKIDIDSETYTAVIGAWASVGDAAQAEDWFARMMEEEKATPEALAFLVDALTLSGHEKGIPAADVWIEKFQSSGQELTAKVYAARASADVISGDFEQVEARMQQMEAVGLEIDEDALTVMLLAYGYAKPQQTLLAEQMFKQQMLRGKVRATREVLEALRLAVGGARCLQLRRELQIGSQKKSPDAAIDYAAKSAAGKNQRPRGRSRIWKSFLPPEPPAKRLKWE
mmetsp:Transcript_67527/g.148018  ORF Transcript_67527/g.148018 Transcript_67527/m.148018 type:complete len:517 (-) Transcript_67527:18-1568(-)